MNIGALTPLQRFLILAGGLLLLPAVIVLTLQFRDASRERQRSIQQAAMEAARHLVMLSDARIEEDKKLLRVLATSPEVASYDWSRALARARTMVELIPGWIAVELSEGDSGRVVFDTTVPSASGASPGTPPGDLTVPPAPPTVAGVVREARHCPCVPVRLPLPYAPNLVLTAYVDPGVFQDMLRRRPPGGVVAIVDHEGRFAARSADYGNRVGTPAISYVLDAIERGGEGFYEGETYEGLDSYTAYATSERTGWSAHVAMDRALIAAPRARSAAAMVTGAIAALALAGGLVTYAFLQLAQRRREEALLVELRKTEALGRFTSVVVHDFNNLLAIMQASLNQIIKHTREPETAERAELARAALARGKRLTGQLLSFARADKMEVGLVDLEEVVGGMDDLLRKTLGPEIRFEARIHPDARLVYVNADQLELALLNLARNARDAMGDDGAFTISTRRDGGMVEIVAADTGTGIAPEVLGRLFEPLVTTKREGKGTGLGLAQVDGAVRQAGGSVRAAATPGGGATFILQLRGGAEPEPALSDAPPAPAAP